MNYVKQVISQLFTKTIMILIVLVFILSISVYKYSQFNLKCKSDVIISANGISFEDDSICGENYALINKSDKELWVHGYQNVVTDGVSNVVDQDFQFSLKPEEYYYVNRDQWNSYDFISEDSYELFDINLKIVR